MKRIISKIILLTAIVTIFSYRDNEPSFELRPISWSSLSPYLIRDKFEKSAKIGIFFAKKSFYIRF